MRKRVVIGVLAIIGVGVLVYVVSHPRKGSVQYHIQAFRDAEDRMFGGSWRWIPWYYRWKRQSVPPRKLPDAEVQVLGAQMNNNRRALVELGYLVESKFILTNQAPRSIFFIIAKTSPGVVSTETAEFCTFAFEGTNVIVITTRPADVPKWEGLIRKADVPTNGK